MGCHLNVRKKIIATKMQENQNVQKMKMFQQIVVRILTSLNEKIACHRMNTIHFFNQNYCLTIILLA